MFVRRCQLANNLTFHFVLNGTSTVTYIVAVGQQFQYVLIPDQFDSVLLFSFRFPEFQFLGNQLQQFSPCEWQKVPFQNRQNHLLLKLSGNCYF
ncbi:hypothetical protein M514_28132, partial [Trichuris suis]